MTVFQLPPYLPGSLLPLIPRKSDLDTPKWTTVKSLRTYATRPHLLLHHLIRPHLVVLPQLLRQTSPLVKMAGLIALRQLTHMLHLNGISALIYQNALQLGIAHIGSVVSRRSINKPFGCLSDLFSVLHLRLRHVNLIQMPYFHTHQTQPLPLTSIALAKQFQDPYLHCLLLNRLLQFI